MKKESTEASGGMPIPEDFPDDEILPEYDLTGGIRGKYAERYARGTNLVKLDPDVARVFPDSEAVNRALRALVQIIEERTQASAA